SASKSRAAVRSLGAMAAYRPGPWVRGWAKDGSWVLASQLSALVATSVLAILIARGLGPSEYGTFAGLMSLAQIITIAAELGLATWLLRELSATLAQHDPTQHPHAAGRLLAPALVLTQVAGLVLVAATVATVALLGYSAQLVACIGALTFYMCQVAIAD